MAEKIVKKDNVAENSKICAILSYFFVGIIWYFVDERIKQNKFARFHAQQGLALLIVYVILIILSVILPFLGIIWLLADIALFILWLIGLIRAATGEMKGVPLVEKLAEKLKI